MRTFLCGVLIVATPLAGCLGGGADDFGDPVERSVEIVFGGHRDAERGSDEYWMVWIHGEETDTRPPHVQCVRAPPSFGVVEHNESVWYRPPETEVDPSDVGVLLALDHEDRTSSCPEVERMVADPPAGYSVEMGAWGAIEITVDANGTLQVAGERVPVGQALVANYRGYPDAMGDPQVEGRFVAEVLGAWDRDRIWERG